MGAGHGAWAVGHDVLARGGVGVVWCAGTGAVTGVDGLWGWEMACPSTRTTNLLSSFTISLIKIVT